MYLHDFLIDIMTARLPLPIDRDCLFDLLLFIVPVNEIEVT